MRLDGFAINTWGFELFEQAILNSLSAKKTFCSLYWTVRESTVRDKREDKTTYFSTPSLAKYIEFPLKWQWMGSDQLRTGSYAWASCVWADETRCSYNKNRI